MTIKTPEELEAMRRIAEIVATVLHRMIDAAEVGMTTRELDDLGATWLAEFGAVSAPIETYDFPGATCISVNRAVAHGVPGPQKLLEGDMVNVDVSAGLDGFWADNGASFVMGEPDPVQRRLLDAALEARDRAIQAIKPGVPYNTLGRIFAATAKRNRLNVIENLCSHGIGRSLHEPPRQLDPVPRRKERRKFTEGQVLAIEPFMTTGKGWVDEGPDGWTLYEVEGALSAQFEHTIVVTADGGEVLTNPIGG